MLADEYAVIACEVAAEDPDVLGTRLETSWRPIERVLGKQAVAELATPDPHRRQGKAQV